ncbi:MAG: hypothetical protein ACRCZ0_09425 [Cetobacterium sp.]
MENLNDNRIYKLAKGIRNRCLNKNYVYYHRYGGRGITCPDTQKERYEMLLSVPGYFDGAEIDRIDNDGNYELSNLRWATRSQNVQNSTWCHDVESYEEKETARSDFKRRCRIRGWDFDDFEEVHVGWRYKINGERERKYSYKLKK